MEYLLNAQEMRECDRNMISQIGMPSMVLMERAALGCVEELTDGSFDLRSVLVVCSTGNNGGDGLAVARILSLRGIAVKVYLMGKEASCTEETRLQKNICEKYRLNFVSKIEIGEYTSIVDAIFGVGLSRNIEGQYADVINAMNHSHAAVMSVDIPSGICADSGCIMGTAVRARKTVTFAYKKIGHILYPGTEYSGKVVVKEIGITQEGFGGEFPKVFSYTKEDLKRLPPRAPYSNKGSYGKVLVVAGSPNMCGAAFLSAKSAYRMGTGLVRIFTEECNRVILQTMLPEAILTTYESGNFQKEQLKEALTWATVVVFGPGLGKSPEKYGLLETVLKHGNTPLVMDADGLNLLGVRRELLGKYPGSMIVTPHIGEMERLYPMKKEEILKNLLTTSSSFAKRNEVICVLKDARTVVSDGESQYVNQSGNNGMAVGGSGDVLTGVIAGLAAQGMEPFEASSLGVYVHGLAGDIARERCSTYGMLATDIIEGLQEILKRGEKEHE